MACIPVVWTFILLKQYSVYIVIRMGSHNCLYTTYSKVWAYIMWFCLPPRNMGRSSCSLAFGMWEPREHIFSFPVQFAGSQSPTHLGGECCVCAYLYEYISNNISFLELKIYNFYLLKHFETTISTTMIKVFALQ